MGRSTGAAKPSGCAWLGSGLGLRLGSGVGVRVEERVRGEGGVRQQSAAVEPDEVGGLGHLVQQAIAACE